MSVRHRMFYYAVGLYWFFLFLIFKRQSPSWSKVSVSHIDLYFFCYFFISGGCNWMVVGGDVCQCPCRHAGSFQFPGEVTLNPFVLNVLLSCTDLHSNRGNSFAVPAPLYWLQPDKACAWCATVYTVLYNVRMYITFSLSSTTMWRCWWNLSCCCSFV